MKITIANPGADIKLQECELNALARLILEKTIEHKKSLNEEELKNWDKKAKKLGKKYARSQA